MNKLVIDREKLRKRGSSFGSPRTPTEREATLYFLTTTHTVSTIRSRTKGFRLTLKLYE